MTETSPVADTDHGDGGAGPSRSDEDVPQADAPISRGPNARPRNETISQSGPGLPDDTSRPVEITPEEEARIAERIRGL